MRRLLGAGAAVVVVVVAAVIALGGSGGTLRRGCISVGLAYSTGGQQIDRCGAAARALCAGAGVPGGIIGEPGRRVAVACRRAGLPVG